MSRNKEETSYVSEMLVHQYNVYAGLSSLALGALLSFSSVGLGLVPILAFLAVEIVAALFIPSSISFRHIIDRDKRAQERDRVQYQLIVEIGDRLVDADNQPEYEVFCRMNDRIKSLERMTGRKNASISSLTVERVHDAAVHYLGLWLARLSMRDRKESINSYDIEDQLEGIAKQLERGDRVMSQVESSKLYEASNRLQRILDKRDQLDAKESTIQASMLSMADSLEELYQRILTSNGSSDIDQHLQGAVEQMKLEDEIGVEMAALAAFAVEEKKQPKDEPHYV